MINSTNFVSMGVGTILKSYMGLTNSDILKEKISYYLTCRNDLSSSRENLEKSCIEINPRISIYRYLCDLIDKPCVSLQTALDSFIKTQEIISTANGSPHNADPILSIEATETSEQTSPFGLNINILEDTKFQCPTTSLNIDYNRCTHAGGPVFGFMLLRIRDSHTQFSYSWNSRRTEINGPGTNSPFADHDGTYVILSFPHPRPEEQNLRRYQGIREQDGLTGRHWDQDHRGYEEARRRPFYASHVCFKVKSKHSFYTPDANQDVSACDQFANNHSYVNSSRRGYNEEHRVGTSKVDIYATTPRNYDKNINAQQELIDPVTHRPFGLDGSSSPVAFRYYGYSQYNRRTFIRWSSYTDIGEDQGSTKSKLSWRFSGRYYGDNHKTLVKNEHIPNLESFAITRDEAYIGNGKLFADRDNILYCPLSGYPLRCCSSVSNSYKKIETYQANRNDWY
jgi:hypothetical protein